MPVSASVHPFSGLLHIGTQPTVRAGVDGCHRSADRQCGALADLLDPWQPALLELLARCAEAGKAAGKPVGVCGKAEGNLSGTQRAVL